MKNIVRIGFSVLFMVCSFGLQQGFSGMMEKEAMMEKEKAMEKEKMMEKGKMMEKEKMEQGKGMMK